MQKCSDQCFMLYPSLIQNNIECSMKSATTITKYYKLKVHIKKSKDRIGNRQFKNKPRTQRVLALRS